MTVPQFADVLAPIPTTHNPMAFFAVSLIALASNVALAAYQLYRIRKLKLNPLKDQIYAGTEGLPAHRGGEQVGAFHPIRHALNSCPSR